jgi:hypothetical protein
MILQCNGIPDRSMEADFFSGIIDTCTTSHLSRWEAVVPLNLDRVLQTCQNELEYYHILQNRVFLMI